MEIPELVPAADYKSKEVELKASIGWLLTKAYVRDIPSDYRQMFYKDDKGVGYIAPRIVQGLTHADIYCKACSYIFREKITADGQGHQAVMQLLSRRGMYVTEGSDVAVTDSMLKQHKPVHLSAHMALIRALIKAHTQDIVTVERVVKGVSYGTGRQRKFASLQLARDAKASRVEFANEPAATTSSSSTITMVPAKMACSEAYTLHPSCRPHSTLGMVCSLETFCTSCDKVINATLSSDCIDGTLMLISPRQTGHSSPVSATMDMGVGSFTTFSASTELPFDTETTVGLWIKKVCSVMRARLELSEQQNASRMLSSMLISFYCPDTIRFQDIVMKENIADSLYNLQLVMLFAKQHLPLPCLHMTLNDIFYAPANLKIHMLTFVAELFHSSQIDPIKCVHRNPVVRHDPGAADFMTEPAEGSPSAMCSSAGPEARLLPRRLNPAKTALQNGEMMSSLPPKGATGNLSHSVRAWGESDQSVHPREGSDCRIPCVGDWRIPCVGDWRIPCVGDWRILRVGDWRIPCVGDWSLEDPLCR
ncbi:Calmodulin-regulated spectrin-associated protein 1 [Lamellibrachia satsuma]|nr:Calmodulin-regulated spectrin-associated protein 1 [Lamellibrachia satsuma]